MPEVSVSPGTRSSGKARDSGNTWRSGLPRPVAVEARGGYRLWLRYADGVEGEVDLTEAVERLGPEVFEDWKNRNFFERRARLEAGGPMVASDLIRPCPYGLYLEITGRVSRFYGIVVRVNYRKGEPPHFCALHLWTMAKIRTRDLALLGGKMPKRAVRLVMEWAAMHQRELLNAWERSRRGESLRKIEPLD